MKNYLKWAVYISAVGIVFALIQYLAGIDVNQSFWWVRLIGSLAQLALLFMGVRETKLLNPSEYTFGKGWTASFMISLLTGTISAIWMFVYTSFINTDLIETQLAATKAAMMANKNMTAEQIDQAMKWSSIGLSPGGFAVTTLLGLMILGMIVGLIISPIVNAVVKVEPDQMAAEQAGS